MKIVFGVMSGKWEMEAEDLIVGKLAMMMFIGKEVPIAIYEPKDAKSFLPSVDFIKEYIDYKRSSVHKAMDSIKEFALSEQEVEE